MSQIVQLRITRPHTQASRLKDRMKVFAGPAEAAAAPNCGLTTVLRRIDTTILPRALTISTKSGGTLRLLVSNRRLMRVEGPDQNAGCGDAPADSDEAAAEFAQRLDPVLRGAERVDIQTARYHTDALFWDVGCGAGRLAALMGVLLQDPTGPACPELAHLLDDRAVARAEVSAGGAVLSVTAEPSAEPMMDRLLEVTAVRCKASDPLNGRREDCVCIPVADGLDAVIISHRSGQTLAILPSEARDAVIEAWHGLIGRAAERGRLTLH